MTSPVPLRRLFLALALVLAVSAKANIYTLNVPIPDGDANGVQSSATLGGFSGAIGHLDVTLNIAGGYDGDFYAYLFHNDTKAILLNRVGRSVGSTSGYQNAGFGPTAAGVQFTLDDSATFDVHRYRTLGYSLNGSGQLTGTWQPDGRSLDPLSAGSAFDTATRGNMLSVFNGMDPNGQWLLFVADLSPGFEGSLVSWGLDITQVPEPSSATLLLLAVGTYALCRRRTRQGG